MKSWDIPSRKGPSKSPAPKNPGILLNPTFRSCPRSQSRSLRRCRGKSRKGSVDLGIITSGVLRCRVCREPLSHGIPRKPSWGLVGSGFPCVQGNCSVLILEYSEFSSLFILSLSRGPCPAPSPGLDPKSTPRTWKKWEKWEGSCGCWE